MLARANAQPFSISELHEALDIVSFMFKNNAFVYSNFRIEDGKIVFSGDAYFDPVLMLLELRAYNIIQAKIFPVGSETDRMEISGGDINALRRIKAKWSNAVDITKLLEELGYVKLPKSSPSDEGYITIDRGDGGLDAIPRSIWNEYWRRQGKEGPSSGWELPTKNQILSAVNAARHVSAPTTLSSSVSQTASAAGHPKPYAPKKARSYKFDLKDYVFAIHALDGNNALIFTNSELQRWDLDKQECKNKTRLFGAKIDNVLTVTVLNNNLISYSASGWGRGSIDVSTIEPFKHLYTIPFFLLYRTMLNASQLVALKRDEGSVIVYEINQREMKHALNFTDGVNHIARIDDTHFAVATYPKRKPLEATNAPNKLHICSVDGGEVRIMYTHEFPLNEQVAALAGSNNNKLGILTRKLDSDADKYKINVWDNKTKSLSLVTQMDAPSIDKISFLSDNSAIIGTYDRSLSISESKPGFYIVSMESRQSKFIRTGSKVNNFITMDNGNLAIVLQSDENCSLTLLTPAMLRDMMVTTATPYNFHRQVDTVGEEITDREDRKLHLSSK